jgi:hypothetical protein
MTDDLTRGMRCRTPYGLGTVAWRRMAHPDFIRVEAYVVILDDRLYDPAYTGTAMRAGAVTRLEGAEPHTPLRTCGEGSAWEERARGSAGPTPPPDTLIGWEKGH